MKYDPPANWGRNLFPLAVGCLPALVFVDFVCASVGWTLPLSLHLILGAFLAWVAYWTGLPYGRKAALGVGGAYLVLCMLLLFAPLGQRKALLRRAHRLHSGMTRQEAVAVMREEPFRDLSGADSWRAEFDTYCRVRYDAREVVIQVDVGADLPYVTAR